MGRVSQKQVLDAILAMPAQIAAAMAANATPTGSIPVLPVDEAIQTPTPTPEKVSVDAAYLSHVSAKLQERANADGNTYVLYARHNKANETKLAYCIADKFSALTDRRIIGAVKTVAPE